MASSSTTRSLLLFAAVSSALCSACASEPEGSKPGGNDPDSGNAGSSASSGGSRASGGTSNATGGSSSASGGKSSSGGTGPRGNTGGSDVSGSGGSGNAGEAGSGATGGGSTPNPELDKACTPGFELNVTASNSRAQVFFDAMGDDPEDAVLEIGRGVCRILYQKAEEVRDATHLTLIIEDTDGVAWKAGNGSDIEVGISTRHLTNIKNEGRDVGYEIKGILYHEMTHMYQHDDSDRDGVDIGIIEGIADFVRLHAGFPAEHWSKGRGGNWNSGYTTTAYFFDWVESEHPGFVHALNLSMDERDNKKWDPRVFETITGKDVETLWDEYQDSF